MFLFPTKQAKNQNQNLDRESITGKSGLTAKNRANYKRLTWIHKRTNQLRFKYKVLKGRAFTKIVLLAGPIHIKRDYFEASPSQSNIPVLLSTENSTIAAFKLM
jgi:hypothetical protein